MATMKWGRNRMTEGESQKGQDQYGEESRKILTDGRAVSFTFHGHYEHYHPQYTPNTTEGVDTSL